MRVLVVEDDAVSRYALESALVDWGYVVQTARDGNEAWQILQREDAPRLVLLDWVMPGMDGLQVCQQIRALGNQPYTYILMLTARAHKQYLVAAMEAGADDYLIKPFDEHELQVRLRAGRRLVELQEELRIQATYDALTGVWNRRRIIEVLEMELARAVREHRSVGILLADFDHFKQVNDTHGHLVGDRLLKEAAQRIRASLRSYNALGRYGGEEFLVVLPGCDARDTLSVAERVRSALAETPVQIPEGAMSITVSLGATVVGPGQPTGVDRVLQAADRALYQAKENGRNCVVLATHSECPPPSQISNLELEI